MLSIVFVFQHLLFVVFVCCFVYLFIFSGTREGRFDDTNKMFVQPTNYDFKVTHKDADMWTFLIKQDIQEKFND